MEEFIVLSPDEAAEMIVVPRANSGLDTFIFVRGYKIGGFIVVRFNIGRWCGIITLSKVLGYI